MLVGEQQPEFSNFDKNDNRGQEAISKRLSVVSRVPFTEEQLFSIFDIVPGLEYCEVQRDPYSNYGKIISILFLNIMCFVKTAFSPMILCVKIEYFLFPVVQPQYLR